MSATGSGGGSLASSLRLRRRARCAFRVALLATPSSHGSTESPQNWTSRRRRQAPRNTTEVRSSATGQARCGGNSARRQRPHGRRPRGPRRRRVLARHSPRDGRRIGDAAGRLRLVPGHQQEVIGYVTAGGGALVVGPTGGGESLCSQVAALVRAGVGVVVSPLIARRAGPARGFWGPVSLFASASGPGGRVRGLLSEIGGPAAG